MAEQMTPISRAISDVLTGAYNKKRLTQEVVAAKADMSIWTLQKKLKGRSPITATDLVILAHAIGVEPAKVLEEALADLEQAPVSEAPVSLDERRKKLAAMSDEEVAELPGAAGHDAELEEDEPEHP